MEWSEDGTKAEEEGRAERVRKKLCRRRRRRRQRKGEREKGETDSILLPPLPHFPSLTLPATPPPPPPPPPPPHTAFPSLLGGWMREEEANEAGKEGRKAFLS